MPLASVPHLFPSSIGGNQSISLPAVEFPYPAGAVAAGPWLVPCVLSWQLITQPCLLRLERQKGGKLAVSSAGLGQK